MTPTGPASSRWYGPAVPSPSIWAWLATPPRNCVAASTAPSKRWPRDVDGRNRTLDAGGRSTGQAVDVRHDSRCSRLRAPREPGQRVRQLPPLRPPGPRPPRRERLRRSEAHVHRHGSDRGCGADRTGDSTSSRSSPRSRRERCRSALSEGVAPTTSPRPLRPRLRLSAGRSDAAGRHDRQLRLDGRTPPWSLIRRTVAEDP